MANIIEKTNTYTLFVINFINFSNKCIANPINELQKNQFKFIQKND